ncbi:alpha/beta fold hydrolase [Roseovarius faecimaris]|uniref:Alpha/beta fold hydrolase n=1 Tax=Roseovarius faecimaris TaxID=2494550 RepID=A0A6I6J2V5_9RHOB|nr:alpha/beta fold hydrolase [Roseovarius faecimaris]QGX99118.1 alpha/beta fold hydrolase [Roseovarius faecimaris]
MRAMLPHTEGVVDRDGVRIHYEVYGTGAHTIVFVPTWAIIHSRSWKAQIPYFAEHFKVVTFDPRGNGKSDRPDKVEDYALDLVLEDVIAVMDATRTERATLVGMSFSSLVALAVAALWPERVEAVVSAGASVPIVPPIEGRGDTFEDHIENPTGWQKYNRGHWDRNYSDFLEFFFAGVFNEKHSTKQREDSIAWALESDGRMLAMTLDSRSQVPGTVIDDDFFRKVRCPCLLLHGDADVITRKEGSERLAELTQGELILFPGGGHSLNGRFPAWFNTTVRDFLARHLGTWKPQSKPRSHRRKRALYLSSPIGLGHARRDLAVTRELRKHHPDLQVDWLAQDPVTRFLDANNESIHPASRMLANESAHIEAEAGEHDLHAFQAIRNMDEILIKNFMVFQEALEQEKYDLVIADEAWDVDHYWHEHPELKRAPIAWFTDFVGWVPFEENGPHEAFLTTDYNAEMIGHVETRPEVRDQAIFVGTAEDIVDLSFGEGLPHMRDWIPRHYAFSDYIIGAHPDTFGSRDDLRGAFGYDDGRKTCIVAVGGSGVGATLIRRILAAYPLAKALLPELRMIVVTGPRLDPAAFDVPDGVEMRAFVPDLDRHLAACDLALVQGGLTTCMELAAAGTPFLYFPLKNHFEQNFHVASRLERYNAGRRMAFDESSPERIASAMTEELHAPRRPHPVAADGAQRAAELLAGML